MAMTAAAVTSAPITAAAVTSATHAVPDSINRASSTSSGELEIVSESDSDEPQTAHAQPAASLDAHAQPVASSASESAQASEESRKKAASVLWKHARHTKDLRLVPLARQITTNGTLQKLDSTM